MLKLTDSEVNAQASRLVQTGSLTGHLTTDHQDQALSVIVQHPKYDANRHNDVETKLANVTGYKAKQILAAMAKMDLLGQKKTLVEIQNLVKRNKDSERIDWVYLMMGILWPKAAGVTPIVPYVTRMIDPRKFD
jgi:hypothetical protein